jgi:hypothetical protein
MCIGGVKSKVNTVVKSFPARCSLTGCDSKVSYTHNDLLPIVFDTGATIFVSPNPNDFILWAYRGHMPNKLNGITASTDVFGVGIVRWTLWDDRGRRHLIDIFGDGIVRWTLWDDRGRRHLIDIGAYYIHSYCSGAPSQSPT